MAYKYKINPVTGKLDLVGTEGGGITNITSEDGTITVTTSGNTVDLTAPSLKMLEGYACGFGSSGGSGYAKFCDLYWTNLNGAVSSLPQFHVNYHKFGGGGGIYYTADLCLIFGNEGSGVQVCHAIIENEIAYADSADIPSTTIEQYRPSNIIKVDYIKTATRGGQGDPKTDIGFGHAVICCHWDWTNTNVHLHPLSSRSILYNNSNLCYFELNPECVVGRCSNYTVQGTIQPAKVAGGSSQPQSSIIYKGTIGTGGTITTLPTASTENTGWQYKVITAGTYSGIEANINDSFISNGSTWTLAKGSEDISKIGDLNDLTTSVKTSVVAAVNEVNGCKADKSKVDGIYGSEEQDSAIFADSEGNVVAKIDKNGVSATAVNVLKDGELKDILTLIQNGAKKPLEGYELFTIGDSLSSGGYWQSKVAELTGCTFSQARNITAGKPLSAGGTRTFGKGFTNGLWRTKNLIDNNFITGNGENAIVVFENGNDIPYMGVENYSFDKTATPILLADPIIVDAFDSANLTAIASTNRSVNGVLKVKKVTNGFNLKVTTLPSKEGDIYLRILASDWRTYYIHVVPQATDEETLAYILERILEYDYTMVDDTLADDGESVDFAGASQVQFYDYSNTGMVVAGTPNQYGQINLPETSTATSYNGYYYQGDGTTDADWGDTSKWMSATNLSSSVAWKSQIEIIKRTYPKAHIVIMMPMQHSATQANYLTDKGYYDENAYSSSSEIVKCRHYASVLEDIAKFYGVIFVDVQSNCGISISNLLPFYNATANPHPTSVGYARMGETFANLLKSKFN